jgi:type II secretory pathway component PulC
MIVERLKHWLQRGTLTVLLEVALIAALGISLAHWTWVMLAPHAVAVSSIGDLSGAAQAAIPAVRRNLFGNAESPSSSAAAGSPSGIRLLGVVSRGAAGSGRAVFALEAGKPRTVEAGAAISQGHVLKEVHADHVVIVRDGVDERLPLDRQGSRKR